MEKWRSGSKDRTDRHGSLGIGLRLSGKRLQPIGLRLYVEQLKLHVGGVGAPQSVVGAETLCRYRKVYHMEFDCLTEKRRDRKIIVTRFIIETQKYCSNDKSCELQFCCKHVEVFHTPFQMLLRSGWLAAADDDDDDDDRWL